MLLTYRFVRLIEDRSDALASGLLHKVQRSAHTESFCKVPPEELKQRVYDIYRHLGEWLLDRSEADIEARYMEIGVRRCHQGVPLSQLIWAIVLTKDNLWEFIMNDFFGDRPVEIFGKLEFLQLLNQFFDRAIHAAAMGYEAIAEKYAGEKSEARTAA